MIADENEVDWKVFRDRQSQVTLPAGSVAHLPVTIRYRDVGEAIKGTVLLMHGIPTWGFLYRHTLTALAEAGYRVLAPDFLGHGWSDRRDCFDRSFQDQARMVLTLLTQLGIDQVHVVGHDTGGAVALILAIEHASKVDRLIICNAVCYDRFDDDMLDLGHPMRWKNRTLAELRTFLEGSLATGLTDIRQLTTEFREGIIAPWASEEGKLSLLRNASALNANQTMALVGRHSAITAPTLVLWGMDDPWQRSEDGQQLAREIPGAQFQPLHGVSHWAPQDAPFRFNKAVLEWLAQ